MAENPTNIKDKNERRDVRRNTSNQIVSYTLPNNSVTQYGLVKLPAIKEELNKEQFERVINTTIEDFSIISPNTDIELISINNVFLPQRAAVVQAISESIPFKFNGDVLQVENKLYYLEDSRYYEILADSPRLGFPAKYLPTLTFLLEKLEKPLLFQVLDPDPELFPEYNPFNRNGYADYNNLIYSIQSGQLVRRDKFDDVIDLKTQTYLNDPEFEDGGIFRLADIADNNITETVVEFNFNLIDEINPAPWEFGFLVDDIGTAYLNNNILVSRLGLNANTPGTSINGERRFSLNNQQTGLNRIGVNAQNLAGPGAVVYDFVNKDGKSFQHTNGWRGQDAYDGQYGNTLGLIPWGSKPINEQMQPSNRIGESPNDNPRGSFWLFNNQFGEGPSRINAEYKWDNRGVRSAAVYRLSGIQRDIGWTPKSNTNSRYGIVKIGNILQVAVETDNFELPNGNITNIIVTLNYKSRPSKTIENSQRSTSWNGKNQIFIEIPAEDVTDDLYKVDISQNQIALFATLLGDENTTPDTVPILIKIANLGNVGGARVTALDQPGRPTVTIPASTRLGINQTSPINYTQQSGLEFDRTNNQTIRFRIEEDNNEFDGIDSRFTNTAASGSAVLTQGALRGSRAFEQDITWDLTGNAALIEIEMANKPENINTGPFVSVIGNRNVTPNRVPILIKIANRSNFGEVRVTALDQPGRPTVTIPNSTRRSLTNPINYTQQSGLQFDRTNNQTIRFRIEEVRNEFDGIDSSFTNTAASGSAAFVGPTGISRPGSRIIEQDITWDLTGTAALIEIKITD